MIINKNYILKMTVIIAAIMLLISCSEEDKATPIAAAPAKLLDPGTSWVISEPIRLRSLTIAGGTISTIEGHA